MPLQICSWDWKWISLNGGSLQLKIPRLLSQFPKTQPTPVNSASPPTTQLQNTVFFRFGWGTKEVLAINSHTHLETPGIFVPEVTGFMQRCVSIGALRACWKIGHNWPMTGLVYFLGSVNWYPNFWAVQMMKCPKFARFFLKSLPLKEAAIRRTKTNGACLTWPISFITCTTGLECTHQVQCLLIPSTLQPKNNTTCSGYWTPDWLCLKEYRHVWPWHSSCRPSLWWVSGLESARCVLPHRQHRFGLQRSGIHFVRCNRSVAWRERPNWYIYIYIYIYIQLEGKNPNESIWKQICLGDFERLVMALVSARISTSQQACACPETSCEDDM